MVGHPYLYRMHDSSITVPSNNDTMLRANATVIHLGRMDTVKVGSNPTRRPMRAVEYNEKIVETMTDVKISAACLLTSCKSIQQTLLFMAIIFHNLGHYLKG